MKTEKEKCNHSEFVQGQLGEECLKCGLLRTTIDNIEVLHQMEEKINPVCGVTDYMTGKLPNKTWEFEHVETMEEVREQIQECEGVHKQQVAYSTFHDGLTQICYGCKKIRSTLNS